MSTCGRGLLCVVFFLGGFSGVGKELEEERELGLQTLYFGVVWKKKSQKEKYYDVRRGGGRGEDLMNLGFNFGEISRPVTV